MTVVPVEIRKALICESAKPACPRCGGVIRRVRAHQGAFVAYCENRVRVSTLEAVRSPPPSRVIPSAGGVNRRCGQHVYIVTRQEFTLLQERPHLTTVELYRRIGILGGAA